MSIIIKGIEMPKGCYKCPIWNWEYSVCNILIGDQREDYNFDRDTQRRADCPLEETD